MFRWQLGVQGSVKMIQLGRREYWYVTGSQHLYGPETLRQVAENARHVVDGLNAGGRLPAPLVFKPVVTTAEAIRAVCLEANNAPTCAGVVLWMHTFSPSKMWIGGLTSFASHSPICIPNSIAICPGTGSTWIS